jgi:small subunit ribosomal protein S9
MADEERDQPETPPESEGTEEQVPAEQPAEEPAAAAAEAPPEEPAAEEPATEEKPPAEVEEPAPVEATAAPDEPAAEAAEAAEPAEAGEEEAHRQRPPRRDEGDQKAEETVVPGAHLEPDLVLDESRPAAPEGEFDPYSATGEAPVAEGEEAATVEDAPTAPAPAARTPLELAADARYRATGKRKRAIARVILKPGAGTYTINGKELDVYFPRVTLQRNARLPLQTTGNDTRMDVVAKIHGGGVSSQAIALRHGISRALVEADPSLRTELKRQGFLTRDARVKERKKAGLKKARKRPQFSKR